MDGTKRAIIHASSGAYLLIAGAAAAGKPLIQNVPPGQQVVLGLLAAGAIQVPRYVKWLRVPMAILYGAAAMASFGGVVQWEPAGSPVTGPAMAAWDLALAACFLSD